MKIKKGDTVKILYGKERGKRGPVVAVDMKRDRVVVEGLNLYKRHLKGDGKTRTSEIVTVEKPFPLSKVMLVCPSCDKPTKVGINKNGKEIERICKKCGKSMEKTAVEEKKEIKKVEKKAVAKKSTTKKSKSKSKSKKE
jgi:large subunit ribosomal protein L24